MKKTRQKAGRPVPVLLLLAMALPLLLAACVTTVSNPEPEKWGPEERAEAHVKLGKIYLRENQLDTAQAEFELAIQTHPKSDSAQHAMGSLLIRRGLDAEAGRFFARAVSLNPNNALAINDYGIFLCQHGEVNKGIKQLQRIENNPENDQQLATNLGFGICYFEAGNNEQAARYLRAVLASAPNMTPALLRMGQLSYAEKNYLSARAFIERYFATGASSERALYLGALVEMALGDSNKANQYRRELQRRYPQSELGEELSQALQ